MCMVTCWEVTLCHINHAEDRQKGRGWCHQTVPLSSNINRNFYSTAASTTSSPSVSYWAHTTHCCPVLTLAPRWGHTEAKDALLLHVSLVMTDTHIFYLTRSLHLFFSYCTTFSYLPPPPPPPPPFPPRPTITTTVTIPNDTWRRMFPIAFPSLSCLWLHASFILPLCSTSKHVCPVCKSSGVFIPHIKSDRENQC